MKLYVLWVQEEDFNPWVFFAVDERTHGINPDLMADKIKEAEKHSGRLWRVVAYDVDYESVESLFEFGIDGGKAEQVSHFGPEDTDDDVSE